MRWNYFRMGENIHNSQKRWILEDEIIYNYENKYCKILKVKKISSISTLPPFLKAGLVEQWVGKAMVGLAACTAGLEGCPH